MPSDARVRYNMFVCICPVIFIFHYNLAFSINFEPGSRRTSQKELNMFGKKFCNLKKPWCDINYKNNFGLWPFHHSEVG